MEYLEFQCHGCRCGLRIRSEHRARQIRCPNCHTVQQYAPPPPGVSPETPWSGGPTSSSAAPTWGEKSLPAGSSLPDQTVWSLRLPDGSTLLDLNRPAFEAEVRARSLGAGTYFIGGDFRQWTPLEKLFQSQVPGRSDQDPLGRGGPDASPAAAAAWSARPAGGFVRTTAGSYRAAVPTYEQQLPAPRAALVFTFGILGVIMPCFIFSLPGLIIGLIDAVKMGNGDLSKSNSTLLIIGIVLCFLGLSFSGCITINMDL